MERKDFWKRFIPIVGETIPLFRNKPSPGNGWLDAYGEIYYFNISTQEKSVAVYICIEKGSKKENEKIYLALKKYEDEIDSLFGSMLVWQGDENRREKGGEKNDSFRIYYQYESRLNYRNEMDFEKITDFLIPSMAKLIEIFDKYFELIEILNEKTIDMSKIDKILSRINRGKEDFEQKFGKRKIRIF